MLEALPCVRRFARSLTGNPDDADDLLQSTVERVLTRKVPEDADLTPWMFRICRNLWIDEIRSRDVRLRATERPELGEERVEDTALENVRLSEVDGAMAELPEEQREIVALVAIEGYAYREAAEILGVPIGTVMSRLARARKTLAARLAPADTEGAKP
jgi:RNA polymerase sigma-70 factor (ECF subfamily)